jgi:hypothetical protein
MEAVVGGMIVALQIERLGDSIGNSSNPGEKS